MFIPALPAFNLSLDYWRPGHLPSTHAADASPVEGQLYLPTKGLLDIQPNAPTFWVPPIYCRVPVSFRMTRELPPYVLGVWGFTDLASDVWYYRVRWWEWVHPGFDNEYLVFLVEQCMSNGVRPDSNR